VSKSSCEHTNGGHDLSFAPISLYRARSLIVFCDGFFMQLAIQHTWGSVVERRSSENGSLRLAFLINCVIPTKRCMANMGQVTKDRHKSRNSTFEVVGITICRIVDNTRYGCD
jgi:hypothetical protein